MEFNAANQSEVSDVFDVWLAFEAVDGFFKDGCHGSWTLEQGFAFVDVLGGDTRCGGGWVCRVGVAVEEFDGVGWAAVHDGVVNFAVCCNRTHWDGGVVNGFGHGDQVRGNAKEFAGGGFAQATEAGDDFIKYQQDAVLGADVTQALQVTLRWQQDAGWAWYGFNNDGGDGWGVDGCGGDNIKKFVEFLVDDKDSPLESDLLTKSLENAQEKIELYNYDIRKNVFQYDDVLNFQRHFIYNIRKELLCNNIPSELITRFGEVFVDEIIASNRPTLQRWVDYYSMYPFFSSINKPSPDTYSKIEKEALYKEFWITQDLRKATYNVHQNAFLEINLYDKILRLIDEFWTAHIERMGNIRETISWKSYGQLDPLVEYNLQAEDSFKVVLEQIKENMLYYSVVRKKPKPSIFNTYLN